MIGTGIATGSMANNLTVYLIDMFNMGKLNAAQISSFVDGCLNIAPLLMAIVADSCFGSFLVISTSIISSSLVSPFSMCPFGVCVCFTFTYLILGVRNLNISS